MSPISNTVTNHHWSGALRLSALLMLIGCGTAPINSYYTLDNTVKTTFKPSATPVCNRPLGIASVNVLPPYDLTKIIFRPDPLEVRYYSNRFWVSPPEDMIRKILARRIDYARLFSEVGSEVNISRPHLSLSVEINNLEEVDKDNSWHARLAMDFTLTNEEEEGTIIWRHRFDVTRKVGRKEIKDVIIVLNDIYNDEMDKVLMSLSQTMGRPGACETE